MAAAGRLAGKLGIITGIDAFDVLTRKDFPFLTKSLFDRPI